MIEMIPEVVDTAILYFHTRCSSGDEIAPFVDEIRVEGFVAATEAMGAVLATSGGYVNAWADQVIARFHIPASRAVLCGHQHGACVALAAAMLRRVTPFALTVLFDPWPLETLYLQKEGNLPATRVVCIDNLWVRERERQRGAETELYKVFRRYGINAEGLTLREGQGQPDEHMFREAIQQIKLALG